MRDHYANIDPRTLGFYRIVVGFLTFCDLLRHWAAARTFYSNSGVLTNHYHLFRPSSGYNFSIFHAFSTIEEVHVAFGLALLCHFFLMIGWHSRVFAALTFMVVTSMDNRLVMVENGGYVVVNLVCFYAMLLPTDRRFSVDAWIRSYRERKEKTVTDLNERYKPAWKHDQYVSLVVALAVMNAGFVYFYNVVNKGGATWRNGQTVYYVLFLNRMVTGLAVFFREHLPYFATVLMTWLVIVHESLLIAWIFSPIGKRITRPCAMVGMWALHTMFGTMMRLGPFSWFMIGWSFLLPVKENWDDLGDWYRKRAERRVVVYDKSSRLAFEICRFLARIDGLELLRFEESEGENPALIEVKNEAGDQRWVDREAFREISQALPGGKYFRWPLQAITLGMLGGALGYMGPRRREVERFFGLDKEAKGREIREDDSPLARKRRHAWRWVREVFFVYLAYSAFDQSIRENKCYTLIQPWLSKVYPQPKIIEATLQYPRIFQGWGMFAPNPITDDGSVSVDAWTIDGRHIDPFTGKTPDLVLTDARGLGLPQITQDYFNRIRLDRNKVFREGLKQWLQRYHIETGNPNDELVAADVYWVRAQCPRAAEPYHLPIGRINLPLIRKAGPIVLDFPSFKTPPNAGIMYGNETIAILTYRKPGYKPPPGMPPIPPEPKVESAGN